MNPLVNRQIYRRYSRNDMKLEDSIKRILNVKGYQDTQMPVLSNPSCCAGYDIKDCLNSVGRTSTRAETELRGR